jgi:hypothetical protein
MTLSIDHTTMAGNKVKITGILTDSSMIIQGQVGKTNSLEWAIERVPKGLWMGKQVYSVW